MFDFSSLLNFFKKKPVEPVKTEEIIQEPAAEKKIQIDDIVVHAMPERFRHQPTKANSAKTAGLLIIGGGAVFLILVSAGLYFYLIKQPAATVKSEPPAAAVTRPPDAGQAQPEIEPNLTALATSTATTTLPGGAVLPSDTSDTSDNSLATSTATTTPETAEAELGLGLLPSLDSDRDGLTDAEEILLKTSTSTPDTDGDLYLDGVELLNLYDPAGPGRLASSTEMTLYENKTFNYSVLYPGAWQMSVNGGDDSIMFKTADNQLFQIIVQPNPAGQSLDQWYLEQLNEVAINDADRLSGPNWQGIKNLDGLTLYLTDLNQKYIFTLAYNPGENNILDYINLFKMMIKSFILLEPL